MTALYSKKSVLTGQVRSIELKYYDQNEFENRLLKMTRESLAIEEVFPELTRNEKEFLLTGATADEWDQYLKYEEFRGIFDRNYQSL